MNTLQTSHVTKNWYKVVYATERLEPVRFFTVSYDAFIYENIQ